MASLELRLLRAASLLDDNPPAAALEAARIVEDHPASAPALMLLGTAYRACGNLAGATATFAQLVQLEPHSAQAQFELGRALAAQDRAPEARKALTRALELESSLAEAWRELSHLHAAAGETLACDRAYATYVRLARPEQHLAEASRLLMLGRLDAAEGWLRSWLKRRPTDVAALRHLAGLQVRREDYAAAEQTLQQCLAHEPGDNESRLDLVRLLDMHQRSEPMLPLLARLLEIDPADVHRRSLLAAAYLRLGRTGEALEIYQALLRQSPQNEALWVAYGNAERGAGNLARAIEAYRKSTAITPTHGEAWFCLANLKTFRFSPEEIAVLRELASRADLSLEDRTHFGFALGKALEDAGDFEGSFASYALGNSMRKAQINYSSDTHSRLATRSQALYTQDFFAARSRAGASAPDPIFIVGLTRSGSTLLEQILASHSQVEGTWELANITSIALELGLADQPSMPSMYPQAVGELTLEQLTALGNRYLAQTRASRISNRPLFIDKNPGNFVHIGLIHLILPNARIIDARRSPLACCFANFKQHFHNGSWYSYDLRDVAQYYRDYVQLMDHYDAVLPGKVHRVYYEHLVADLETQVRRLLAYCGLSFEESCLRFHETRREVRTASSEQVRRPLYSEAIEHWRNYEPWLGELKEALGDLVEQYPPTPQKP